MPRWLRVYGGTALGAFIGLLLSLALLVPLVKHMRSSYEWDGFASPAIWSGFVMLVALILFAMWLMYLVGRFAYKVATYEETHGAGAGGGDVGSWSGEGWSVRMTADAVLVQVGEQRHEYRGTKRSYLTVRRQGASWLLETPDGVRELPGMDEAQARSVQAKLLDLPFDD